MTLDGGLKFSSMEEPGKPERNLEVGRKVMGLVGVLLTWVNLN